LPALTGQRSGTGRAVRDHVTHPARFASVVLLVTATLLLGMFGLGATAALAGTSQAVVSLTFDDGNADQYTNAFPVLQQYGMHGTFYIVTGFIGVNSANMTLAQLQTLYNAGNEIAGHTVLHPDLTQVSTDEATREICDGRNTLLNWGFPVTDFAYPYADSNSTTEGLAQQCGYNSARSLGELNTPYGCQTCAPTESIPPADPYNINAPGAVTDQWTLADLESVVTQAENAGGWMPITFHHICSNDCDPYSVSPALFSSFIQWLSTQPVSVQTVSQVIGGPTQPAVSAPEVSPTPPGTNGVANPSLETANQYAPSVPYCWTRNTIGTNTSSFAETGNAHTGSVAETVTMSSYSSGEARLITTQDLGQCTPAAVSGDQYAVSAWYQSTAPAQFAFWYRDASGGWHYWTASPLFPASPGWTQATWGTPAVPSGATALSFGMQIGAAGTLTTDDYSLSDTGGPPVNPTVSVTSPSSGATLAGQVTFSANASSASGISKVDFLVNGVVVGTATSSPYTVTWDSTTVSDGPVTVTARATDTLGNTTTANQAATISNAPNRGGNMLANASLESYSNGSATPDCWQQGGYGTNAASWTKTPNAHTGNWAQSVSVSSYTSGDRKLVTLQNASACSPRVTPGHTYNLGVWYESNQKTHIEAYYENSSGSWVYWTQGPTVAVSSGWAQATWTTPPIPSGAVALSFGLYIASVGSVATDDYTMTAN
jgi:peptidoglycan/xylan/chitin deacetylase (PgdA/CDA1 family)